MKKLILLTIIFSFLLLKALFAEEAHVLLVENDKINQKQLNIMLLSGSKKIKLVENGISPIWSPDKNKIAFLTISEKSHQMDLSVINLDGTNHINLTKEFSKELVGDFFITNLTWFPDGNEIAYVLNEAPRRSAIKNELHIVNLKNKRITKLLEKEGTGIDNIAISHKGDKMAYVLRYGIAAEVFIMDLKENKSFSIKTNGIRDVLPMWSEDDRKLFFYSAKNIQKLIKDYSNVSYDILAADSISGTVTTLIPDVFMPLFPVFPYMSPDGKRISYFASKNDRQTGNLTIKDLTTNKMWQIKLTNLMNLGNLIWSKDGKHLLYISYKEGDSLFLRKIDIEKTEIVELVKYELNPEYLAIQMSMPLKFIDW